MKKILYIAFWSILAIGLVILLGFSSKWHKNTICERYDIIIEYNDADTFLRIGNIEKEIMISGDSIIGKTLNDIQTNNIEEYLKNDPYIKNADVFSTVEGNIRIKVVQRMPLVRVINKNNSAYYIDMEGNLMPLSKKATSRVIVANGNIRDKYSATKSISINSEGKPESNSVTANLMNIFYLATYINEDIFLKTMIDQIYIKNNDEIELIPKVGNQLIEFGTIDDLELKFEKLKALYKDGFKKTGWSQYKTINLKYKNQVVCSKK